MGKVIDLVGISYDLKASGNSFNYILVNSDTNLQSFDFAYLDTSASPFTLTLPPTPKDNDMVGFLDIKGNASVNNITIARNGNTIMGLDEDLVIDTDNAHFYLIYINGDWRLL